MKMDHHLKQTPSMGDIDDAVSTEIDEEYADCGFEYDSPKSMVEGPDYDSGDENYDYDDFDYDDGEEGDTLKDDTNDDVVEYGSMDCENVSKDKTGAPKDSLKSCTNNTDVASKSKPAQSHAEPNREKVLYDSDGNNLRFFFNPFVFSPSEECLKTAIHRLVYEHLCYGGSCKNLQNGVIKIYYNPVVQSNEDLERAAKMIVSIIRSGRIPYDK